MPSKKRKYNARFPAGRIKKIMQTDEEVGKVAQAVPIIISRTLELFVESLLSKAMQVTMSRSAKTLSPSHVKQCILSEARFDFLRDLVKNIPDVSAAEEKEMQMSAESSPNSTRFSEMSIPPRRSAREGSNSSSSSDVKTQLQHMLQQREAPKRALSTETELAKLLRPETVTSHTPTATIVSSEVMDLSKKDEPIPKKPIVTANFYQETLPDDTPHRSVITVNPTYTSPQPSTSTCLTPLEPVHRLNIPLPTSPRPFYLDTKSLNNNLKQIPSLPITPVTPSHPITPILNIDFSKNFAQPEIKVLDTTAIVNVPGSEKIKPPKLQRQTSKTKAENKRHDIKPAIPNLISIDHINSGNLQIDEDYDT